MYFFSTTPIPVQELKKKKVKLSKICNREKYRSDSTTLNFKGKKEANRGVKKKLKARLMNESEEMYEGVEKGSSVCVCVCVCVYVCIIAFISHLLLLKEACKNARRPLR